MGKTTATPQLDPAQSEGDAGSTQVAVDDPQETHGNAFLQAQMASDEAVDLVVVDNSDAMGMLDNLMHSNAITGVQSIEDLANRVDDAREGSPVGTLQIYGHADPGMQIIGEDEFGYDVGMSADGVRRAEPALKRVEFAASGKAELHGCEVAQGPDGTNLLTELSRIWRVPVTGATVIQRAMPGLEGTTKTANPDGSVDVDESWWDWLHQTGDG